MRALPIYLRNLDSISQDSILCEAGYWFSYINSLKHQVDFYEDCIFVESNGKKSCVYYADIREVEFVSSDKTGLRNGIIIQIADRPSLTVIIDTQRGYYHDLYNLFRFIRQRTLIARSA